MNNYENFHMQSTESIHEMFTRFMDIVNKVKVLGK